MQPNEKFQKLPKNFWAQVRLISMTLGYSKGDEIKKYTIDQIVDCLKFNDLGTEHLVNESGKILNDGKMLIEYFEFRSHALKNIVEPNLMDRAKAKVEFDKLEKKFKSKIPTPYNKQSGTKRHPAYLTGIINLLTENALESKMFDYDPRKFVVVTDAGKPLRTLSRRVDGTYPSTVNPKAIWEIKEYYGTTTFGSRVADGVYETLLDGYELEELRLVEKIDIKHYLIVDDYFTWWKCGKSYLCKLIDMMHEGFVDEVLFGKEIVSRWPEIVKSWK